MSTSLVSIKGAISFGWSEFKKDAWFFVSVTAGLLIFSIVVDSLTSGIEGAGSIIGMILSLVASAVLTIAFVRLALSTVAGQRVGWNGLWAPQFFLPVLGAIVIQSVIVLIGLVLLIIPGIIASVLLGYTQFAVIDKKMMPVEAVRESYRLTRPHLLQLFLFTLALAVLNIVGLLALGVGLLVTIPVSLIAMASVYRKLITAQESVLVINAPSTP